MRKLSKRFSHSRHILCHWKQLRFLKILSEKDSTFHGTYLLSVNFHHSGIHCAMGNNSKLYKFVVLVGKISFPSDLSPVIYFTGKPSVPLETTPFLRFR